MFSRHCRVRSCQWHCCYLLSFFPGPLLLLHHFFIILNLMLDYPDSGFGQVTNRPRPVTPCPHQAAVTTTTDEPETLNSQITPSPRTPKTSDAPVAAVSRQNDNCQRSPCCRTGSGPSGVASCCQPFETAGLHATVPSNPPFTTLERSPHIPAGSTTHIFTANPGMDRGRLPVRAGSRGETSGGGGEVVSRTENDTGHLNPLVPD